MTLTPAYGRDYKSAKEARAAFDDNQDFIVNSFNDPWDGKPVNKEQLLDQSPINIRYNKLRKVTVVA